MINGEKTEGGMESSLVPMRNATLTTKLKNWGCGIDIISPKSNGIYQPTPCVTALTFKNKLIKPTSSILHHPPPPRSLSLSTILDEDLPLQTSHRDSEAVQKLEMRGWWQRFRGKEHNQ